MFEYTRAGFALNGLIGAIQSGDSGRVADKLTKLVRHDPMYIVDNFLGNLKVYERLQTFKVQQRKAAAIQAMDMVEKLLPEVSNIIELRVTQAELANIVVADYEEQSSNSTVESSTDQEICSQYPYLFRHEGKVIRHDEIVFVVDGKSFNSTEEAKRYVDELNQ